MATPIYSHSFDGDDNTWPNYSGRILTGKIGASLASGGTTARVRFVASSDTQMVANNCAIGVWTGVNRNTVATPVELLFSGLSGFSLSAGQSIVSDFASISFAVTDDLVVIIDFANVSNGTRSDSADADDLGNYVLAAPSYNVATPADAGTNQDFVGFDLIETDVGLDTPPPSPSVQQTILRRQTRMIGY